MNKLIKALAVVVLAAVGAQASAAPISGNVSFAANGAWIETGALLHGFDFDNCTGSGAGCPNPSGNIHGIVVGSVGDIADVLGVAFADAIEVYDFDLLGPLPSLEWLIETDDGSGLTGILSFEITSGSGTTEGGTKTLSGGGVLDFACLTSCGGDNAGFESSDNASWLITGSSSHVTAIIGTNVPEPTTMALFGAALIAWSFTRRRRAVEA